jgi:site-specific recombinase XerD
MDFEQALESYLRDAKPTPSLTEAMKQSWARFSEFCDSQNLNRLENVAPCHVQAFQQKLNWEPGFNGRFYAANTVDHILRQVRTLLRWATKSNHLVLDPTLDLVLCRPPQPKARFLTWRELQRILAAPDRTQPIGLRDAAMLSVMTETDLGLQRCLNLDLKDEPELSLEGSTRELLGAYLKTARPLWLRSPGQKALFITKHGARLGELTVGNRLDEIAKIADVEGNVTPRMLWRSYRAELARAGNSRLPSSLN